MQLENSTPKLEVQCFILGCNSLLKVKVSSPSVSPKDHDYICFSPPQPLLGATELIVSLHFVSISCDVYTLCD